MTASAPGGERGQGLGGAGREHSGTGVAVGARSDSASAPIGRGTGAADAPQMNLSSYTAALTRKLEPYWKNAFPTWARLEGRSAVAVIGVTLRADGKVMEARVVRPSGIPEFDAKVLAAVFEAGPYAPLPATVRDRGLKLHIAFDAMNPAVGHSVR
jgi:TonB family protein